ncbi:hypothetical protein Tco_1244958 [Tanacetum coccineum]
MNMLQMMSVHISLGLVLHLNDVWTKQFKPRSSSKDVWTKQFRPRLVLHLDDVWTKQFKPRSSSNDIWSKRFKPRSLMSNGIRWQKRIFLKEFDLKSALFKHMNKNKNANRNPANYHLYHALMEALIADEDAMDKEVAVKVKDHKRKHDSDDEEDDDDDEGPSAGSNQGRSAKRRRPESATSGSAQPPSKDDHQSSKKPWESDASASIQHPALTSTGWQITDTRDDVVNSLMHMLPNNIQITDTSLMHMLNLNPSPHKKDSLVLLSEIPLLCQRRGLLIRLRSSRWEADVVSEHFDRDDNAGDDNEETKPDPEEIYNSGPGPQLLTPRTISSGLIPQPPSPTPNVPPTKNDWDLLFCPMLDEYFNPSPSVVQHVLVVVVQEPVVSTGTPSSTRIDQDTPSTSTSQTTQEEQSHVIPTCVEEDDHGIEVAHMDNDLPVSTRLQLQTEALLCYYDALLSSSERKSYKDALTKSCWIDAMKRNPDGSSATLKHAIHVPVKVLSISGAEGHNNHNGGILITVPILQPGEYDLWKMRREQYLQCIDYTLWEIIENGNPPIVTKTVDGKETVIPPTSIEEKVHRRAELKARSTLLIALSNEHQLKFNSYKDAKTLI